MLLPVVTRTVDTLLPVNSTTALPGRTDRGGQAPGEGERLNKNSGFFFFFRARTVVQTTMGSGGYLQVLEKIIKQQNINPVKLRKFANPLGKIFGNPTYDPSPSASFFPSSSSRDLMDTSIA